MASTTFIHQRSDRGLLCGRKLIEIVPEILLGDDVALELASRDLVFENK